ncbi:hypothetical protein BJY52DRAFT_136248 [Lactarius psammicola]|nr:hypothetical protein BJY52DRAFT_136248 [Lactarius psammicola]
MPIDDVGYSHGLELRNNASYYRSLNYEGRWAHTLLITLLVFLPPTTLNPHICERHDNGHNFTADLIDNMTLGAFGNPRRSETLNHLIRYLSTWSGSDKLFMLIQYGAKVLVPILQGRARLQHRAGVHSQPTSPIAPKLAKLANISSTCSLWCVWRVLSIIHQFIALERTLPPTPRLLTIERTQGWSMLAFFPSPVVLFPPHERPCPLCASPPHIVRKAPTRDDQRRRGLAVVDAPLGGVHRAPARAPARRSRLVRQATKRARQSEHTRETAAAGARRACASVGRMVQRAHCQLELSLHGDSLVN